VAPSRRFPPAVGCTFGEGHFRGYERVDGVMVPRGGEVAWILPEGQLTYWRGRIVVVEYGG